MLSKVNRLMEPFWFIVAICALVVAVYEYFQNAWDSSAGIMFGISGLAFIWFGMRRMLRKRMEKTIENDNNNS
jgi:hypothetical protein